MYYNSIGKIGMGLKEAWIFNYRRKYDIFYNTSSVRIKANFSLTLRMMIMMMTLMVNVESMKGPENLK